MTKTYMDTPVISTVSGYLSFKNLYFKRARSLEHMSDPVELPFDHLIHSFRWLRKGQIIYS